MEEMRCARNALATSLESSEDQRLVVMILSLGIHFSYTAARVAAALSPSGVRSPPMRTRLGASRSRMAVPSARNSGLLRIWNLQSPSEFACKTRAMVCAVMTGTVDFSTTMHGPLLTFAIVRAASSRFFTFAAEPLPIPAVLVGVLTATKMICEPGRNVA